MFKKHKLALLKDRLSVLERTEKNIKCPGVTRKIRRQIRNMEKLSD